jgi:ATP-dependent RNA helicase DDX35
MRSGGSSSSSSGGSSGSGGGSGTAKFWRPAAADEEAPVLISPYAGAGTSNKQHATAHSLQVQRLGLPIYTYKNHLLYAIENYQTVVVISETGTGKSTQIPQYLYEAGWTRADPLSQTQIVCTQPRRLAAISLASRVGQEMNVAVGSLVGYHVRFESKYADPPSSGSRTPQGSQYSHIKYVTDGVLVRETLTDPLLSKYSVIMVDEVGLEKYVGCYVEATKLTA